MANITINKNALEIRSELKANGTTIEYIVINGQKIGILGSVTKTDREAALKAIQEAYVASNGNIMEMMQKLATIATIEEKGIEPDEMIEINGVEVIISYKNATAYTIDGDEIVSCADLPSMPAEAIKAVLVARMEAII